MPSLASAPGILGLAIGKSHQLPDREMIALGAQFNELTRSWHDFARRTNLTYENVEIAGLIGAVNSIEAAIVARRD